jgi:hypothetical protein
MQRVFTLGYDEHRSPYGPDLALLQGMKGEFPSELSPVPSELSMHGGTVPPVTQALTP